MPLKTLVKVSRITNLSDARYCAGMGADMLGFSVISGTESYIAPAAFQEIRGWVAGPRIVAEINGLKDATQLPVLMQSYAPDHWECTLEDFELLGSHFQIEALVRLKPNQIPPQPDMDGVTGWIVNNPGFSFKTTRPIFVEVNSKENAAAVLRSAGFSGLVLNGSPEVRPGFKDYDVMADVLEMLDE